ncbi:hypothetical protein ACXET9_09860 [Brachybacterium sp. DNPG3]
MEINPYAARLRMLQQMDGVQQQREAAPDDETAGCPGCPYFWTCPVPHKGVEVTAPPEIELDEVRDQLGGGREYRPRDESDIGWSDVWYEDDEIAEDGDDASEAEEDAQEDAEEPESSADDGTPEEPASPRRRWFSGRGRRRR